MRVGVVGPLSADSLATNILHCLQDLDVTPIPLYSQGPINQGKLTKYSLEALRRLGAEGELFTQRPIAKRALEAECDVVINTLQALMPEVIQPMKDAGIKVAVWYPDHVANLGRLSIVSSDYDAVFLKDPLLVQRFTKVYGMPAHYLPEACNPTWHHPVGDPLQDAHIAVVGNIYATRARLLVRLAADGVPLRLYGGNDGHFLVRAGDAFPRWFDPGTLKALHAGGPVFRMDKSKVFRQARGVLNNLHPAEMASVNCRLFEATAAGGAVLCERRDSLAELFSEGSEVLGFSSYAELLDHCRTLIEDPVLGTEIGDTASRRALRDHTYQMRLRELLTILV